MSDSPSERPTEQISKQTLLLGTFLVLAVLLLYAGVRHNQFLAFDDGPYVTENQHVRTGLSLQNAAWAFSSYYQSNWHPLTWLSHMTDCQLFGLNPGPHHLVNVALHAANALLLFWLLQSATGAVWSSFLVATLFAVHPLNIEVVAWVAERKSLLSTLFSLLTIAAYGSYVKRPNWKRYLTIIAAYSLALMSKPMTVTLPVLMLLLDYWPLQRYEDLPLRRKWLRLTTEKLPLFLMSAASAIVTFLAAHRAGGTVADLSALPIPARLGNAAVSYVTYIEKIFFPARLAVFYPHPGRFLAWPDVIAAIVILGAITAAVLYLHRARYLVTGWFLFLIALIPVIGIVQVGHQAMADRYAYIPCIGLFIAIVWSLSRAVDAARIPRWVPALVALFATILLAAATVHYLQYWQSGAKLFNQARLVAGRPDFFIEEPLADALYADGQLGQAAEHYEQACLLRPNYLFCHYNLGQILFRQGKLPESLEQYQIALHLADNREMAVSCLLNSGEILSRSGDYEAAQIEYTRALEIDPGNSTVVALRQRAADQEKQHR